MPLWWRDDFERNLDVQALHDGTTIALRLSWNDKQADNHAGKTEAFEDAVAVELYRGKAEPFLGMGAKKSELEVWMWDADRQNGFPGGERVNPRIVVDSYPFSEKITGTAEYNRPGTKNAAQPGVSLTAKGSGNQIAPGKATAAGGATSLETGGPGTVTFRPPINQSVRGNGDWKNGRWSVVLTRPMSGGQSTGTVPLTPGEKVSVAFAVWNGSQRDRDGKKLITIWQDLQLEAR